MKYDVIMKELNEIDLRFSSVFLTIFQIFSPEVTLICDQVLINVGTYDPLRTYQVRLQCKTVPSSNSIYPLLLGFSEYVYLALALVRQDASVGR